MNGHPLPRPDDVGATEKTIKVHRGPIMAKMHTNSLVDLARMTEKIGIGRPRRKSEEPEGGEARPA